jgi:hypothetical protein
LHFLHRAALWYRTTVSIEKSADLEMDGSGKSTGFSRTVGGRIASKSKNAGHAWLAVWSTHASQGGSRRSRIPLGERNVLLIRSVKSDFALLLAKVTKPIAKRRNNSQLERR